MNARYGSSACSSWTSRSASVTPSSPIVTTSGWRPSQADALVAVLAEDHRLAVLEDEHPVLADLAVGEVAPGAVVEDVAVLEDLDERRALVPAGPLERRPGGARCGCRPSGRRSVASAARAIVSGMIGVSTVPTGVDFVCLPNSEVGDAWPLVSP